jgi:RpiB/LacA/LacB family sugar-phosphate isomerase
MSSRAVVIASDHAAVELKNEIKKYLIELGYEVEDLGPKNNDSVDYPDFASAVAAKVSRGEYERGILMCGSGIGMAIVANKFPNVRAVNAADTHTAIISRSHNDTNILTLGSRTTPLESAKEIVKVWLATEFEGGRHEKRIEKIKKIEEKITESR